jgi:hypothetical protein
MDIKNLVYFLSGYLEDKTSLNEKETQRIKDLIVTVTVTEVPPLKPTKKQVEKMVKALFPDLTGVELENAIKHYRNE